MFLGIELSNKDYAALMRLQMVAHLPAGDVVDTVILEIATRPTLWSAMPLPNNLTPRGVEILLDRLPDTKSTAAGPVLTGLQDIDAVRVLAQNASKGWLQRAVQLNPVSEGLNEGDLVTPRRHGLFREDTTAVVLAALPNLPWIKTQPALYEEFHLTFLRCARSYYSRFYGWDYLPAPLQHYPWEVEDHWNSNLVKLPPTMRDHPTLRRRIITRRLDEAGGNTPDTPSAVREVIEAMVAEDDPKYGRIIMDTCTDPLWGDLLGWAFPEMLGGRGHPNPWLRQVLFDGDAYWKPLLLEGWKPVAGELVGQELYKVTGDDVGLWMTALDLLEGWKGSLYEWLEAVEALA